jgi:dTDP-D-glucose 4,6-dehydratase
LLQKSCGGGKVTAPENDTITITDTSYATITKYVPTYIPKWHTKVKYVQDRLGHDFRYAISGDKIKQSLGYHPKHKFEEALSFTIDWYTKNPNWWVPKINNLKS